jgi:hypothetical protein
MPKLADWSSCGMLSAIFLDSATSQQNAPHLRRVELRA